MTIKPITEAPNPYNGIYNPPAEMLYADGFRIAPPIPEPAEGYTRIAQPVLVDVDGINGQWDMTGCDRLTSEIEAEERAAEAIRKATPIVYDQPIEAPFVSVLSQTGNKGIGITATDEGVLVPFIVHESPWPDKDALKAKIDAAVAKRNGLHAAGKAGVHGQLQARIENIERFLGWRD